MLVKNFLVLVPLITFSVFISTLSLDTRFLTYLSNYGDYSSMLMYFLPGLGFGLVMSIYFYLENKVSIEKITSWTLSSVAAWFAAFMIGSLTMGLASFLGGIVGTIILTTAVRRFISKIEPVYPLIIAGCIASIISHYLFRIAIQGSNDFPHQLARLPIFLSFLIWQIIVGVTIGITIALTERNKKVSLTKLEN